MVIRLLTRKSRSTRFAVDVVQPEAYCPLCGQALDDVQGTTVGAFKGVCPDHGDVDDPLTA